MAQVYLGYLSTGTVAVVNMASFCACCLLFCIAIGAKVATMRSSQRQSSGDAWCRSDAASRRRASKYCSDPGSDAALMLRRLSTRCGALCQLGRVRWLQGYPLACSSAWNMALRRIRGVAAPPGSSRAVPFAFCRTAAPTLAFVVEFAASSRR